MNISDWLTSRTQATPQKTALIIGEQQWTYAELNRMVNSVCARLVAADVTAGDFVGVLMPNCLEYVCIIHALARLGTVLVPLNTRLTVAELAWQVAHVGCEFILCVEETKEKLSMVNSQFSIVNETWLAGDHSLTINNSELTIDNLQSVVFTSGTSGKPKGVPLTFQNHFSSAMASAYRLGVEPNDVWLSCLPLYHVGGLAVIWRSCLYGTAVNLHPRFILEEANQALDSLPITLISLVPTMLYRLLETRNSWPETLRLALIGGAAATQDLVTKAQTANVPIATTYGLTEASSQVATMLPEDVAQKPGSVGKPLLFTSVDIVDENGRSLPLNEYGEIVVSGPSVMAGYFNEQRTTNNDLSFIPHPSSFHTGDIGYLDDDSDLWIVQRRSDLIVSGGENVYPVEVEAVLKMHPAVVNACVVGVPDAEWGQVVVAMVQSSPDSSLTEADLLKFSRDHLAGYKQPRLVLFVTELPQTASGKIARSEAEKMMANAWKNA